VNLCGRANEFIIIPQRINWKINTASIYYVFLFCPSIEPFGKIWILNTVCANESAVPVCVRVCVCICVSWLVYLCECLLRTAEAVTQSKLPTDFPFPLTFSLGAGQPRPPLAFPAHTHTHTHICVLHKQPHMHTHICTHTCDAFKVYPAPVLHINLLTFCTFSIVLQQHLPALPRPRATPTIMHWEKSPKANYKVWNLN